MRSVLYRAAFLSFLPNKILVPFSAHAIMSPMTCIVGLETPEGVWIGGDSAVSEDESDRIQTLAAPKVFKLRSGGPHGEILVGFSESLRAGQVVKYGFSPPRCLGKSPEEYLSTDFSDALLSCMRTQHSDADGHMTCQLLIGYRKKLFMLDGWFGVVTSAHGYSAIGAGEDIALGSLYSTRRRKPEERIILALKAASEFNAFVRPPFTVVSQ